MEGETCKFQSGSCSAPDEHVPSLPPIQKHEEPGRGDEDTEEEEEAVEEDVSSSSSESEDSEEEEEEEGMSKGRHGHNGARHTQLEWDDSALPY